MPAFTGPRLTITAPRTIEYRDHTTTTDKLGPSALVVKTRYTLISPGTEGSIYTGENKRVYEKGAWCEYPFNSGYTNLGEVVWCGPEVTRFAVGDFVFTTKKHGAFYAVDTTSDIVVKVAPDQAKPRTLLARMANISATAPMLSARTLGASVLVYGLGAVGNLAAQLYTIGGSIVVGVDPNPVRRRIADDSGIAATCGPDPDEIRATLARIGLGEKADIVVDAVGVPDLDLDTAPFTQRNGEYVLLGSPKLESTKSALGFFRYEHLNVVKVIGAIENAIPDHAGPGQVSREKNLELMVRLIAEGRLKVDPLLSHILPYRQAKEGYEGLTGKQEEYTGVALDWTGGEA
jgi:threonine dehydrogenase-like Zn-dependent dehydrogenase